MTEFKEKIKYQDYPENIRASKISSINGYKQSINDRIKMLGDYVHRLKFKEAGKDNIVDVELKYSSRLVYKINAINNSEKLSVLILNTKDTTDNKLDAQILKLEKLLKEVKQVYNEYITERLLIIDLIETNGLDHFKKQQ